jgi:PAS domain-containing protein
METILDRQLRRLGLDADTPPSEAQWRALLDRVRRTYGEFERDRYTIERSLERMSSEMLDLNDDLRAASARQLVEQERLRAVISALGDGLGALDRDGRLVLLNVAGARLVGADASDSGLALDDCSGRECSERIRVTNEPRGHGSPWGVAASCGKPQPFPSDRSDERVVSRSAALVAAMCGPHDRSP